MNLLPEEARTLLEQLTRQIPTRALLPLRDETVSTLVSPSPDTPASSVRPSSSSPSVDLSKSPLKVPSESSKSPSKSPTRRSVRRISFVETCNSATFDKNSVSESDAAHGASTCSNSVNDNMNDGAVNFLDSSADGTSCAKALVSEDRVQQPRVLRRRKRRFRDPSVFELLSLSPDDTSSEAMHQDLLLLRKLFLSVCLPLHTNDSLRCGKNVACSGDAARCMQQNMLHIAQKVVPSSTDVELENRRSGTSNSGTRRKALHNTRRSFAHDGDDKEQSSIARRDTFAHSRSLLLGDEADHVARASDADSLFAERTSFRFSMPLSELDADAATHQMKAEPNEFVSDDDAFYAQGDYDVMSIPEIEMPEIEMPEVDMPTPKTAANTGNEYIPETVMPAPEGATNVDNGETPEDQQSDTVVFLVSASNRIRTQGTPPRVIDLTRDTHGWRWTPSVGRRTKHLGEWLFFRNGREYNKWECCHSDARYDDGL
ncbi:MAG: hypothetical protein MHM6MM_004092 [Cercozoa sp. M6MM]